MWFGDGADCAGYEVPFTSLTMHAVSRGAEDGDADFTSPCIYAQVEGTPPEGFGATIAGGGGGDVEALLATLREAAKDPEVFHEMLAALPPEQRAAIEAHMADQ